MRVTRKTDGAVGTALQFYPGNLPWPKGVIQRRDQDKWFLDKHPFIDVAPGDWIITRGKNQYRCGHSFFLSLHHMEEEMSFKDEVKDELQDLLTELGQESEDIKILAFEVGEMGVDVAEAAFGGQDTTVAEAALKASVLNLASASTTALATAVVRRISSVLKRASTFALSAAIAAL